MHHHLKNKQIPWHQCSLLDCLPVDRISCCDTYTVKTSQVKFSALFCWVLPLSTGTCSCSPIKDELLMHKACYGCMERKQSTYAHRFTVITVTQGMTWMAIDWKNNSVNSILKLKMFNSQHIGKHLLSYGNPVLVSLMWQLMIEIEINQSNCEVKYPYIHIYIYIYCTVKLQ